MMRTLILMRSNIRKAKGQLVTIFVLILIAAILLNIWLILSLNYSRNYDARAELLNSEDVLYTFQRQDQPFKNFVSDVVSSDKRTDEFTVENCLSFSLNCRYGNGDISTYFVFYPVAQAQSKTLGAYRFVEKSDAISDNAIYLPYLFYSGGNFRIGDQFGFTFENKSYQYTIGGFFENMLAGSFNGGICAMLMEQSAYDALSVESGASSISVSVKLTDRADNFAYASQVGNKLMQFDRKLGYNYTCYDSSKEARNTTAQICSTIVSIIAFLVVAIALIVISFSVSNTIDEDLKSLGALKALGYRSKQLISTLLSQFLFIGAIGVLCGTALSYVILPILNTMLVAQTGIPWSSEFFIIPMILSLGIILLTIAAVVCVSARKIGKITPLAALRQGVNTHNFKTNPLPLERIKVKVNTALALKTMSRNVKQNAAVFFIVIMLSVLMVFSGVMYQNFTINPDNFLGLVSGEQAGTSAMLTTTLDSESEVFNTLLADEKVEKIYSYYTSAIYDDDGNIMCYVTESDKLNNPDMCYDGRLPKHDNETAIGGRFAQQQGYKIGDKIILHVGEKQFAYLICGFIQSASYFGRDCIMTPSAFANIDKPTTGSLYLKLKDDVDVNEFIESVKTTFGTKVLSIVNTQEVINGSLGVYSSLVGGIVAVILILTLLVISFVLYLIVKTLLIRKKQDYGICKAIGFTTRQLVLQTAGSFMPVIIFSAIVGTIIGVIGINPLLTLFFNGLGIMKCTFVIPSFIIALLGMMFIFFAFAISCLVSLRIRRITPRELLTRE